MIPIIIVCLVLVVVAALALAPPTFLSDLFDGEKRRKKDWTEED
jgi:hypothetical protein